MAGLHLEHKLFEELSPALAAGYAIINQAYAGGSRKLRIAYRDFGRRLKSAAPVDTGYLRRSIAVTPTGVRMVWYGWRLNELGRHAGWIDREVERWLASSRWAQILASARRSSRVSTRSVDVVPTPQTLPEMSLWAWMQAMLEAIRRRRADQE